MTEAFLFQSRGLFEITGEDRKNFLQGIITQDIDKIMPGAAIYAALLTPQGKYLYDFFIIEDGNRLIVDCFKDRMPEFLKRLTMYRLRSKAQFADLSNSHHVIAFRGELDLPASALVYQDPRLEDLGKRAIIPRSELAEFQGEDGYDRLRLSLGIPGHEDFEIDKTLILEGNLDALNGVSFTKGCYVGQELTTRTKHRGKVRRRLLPVTVDGLAPSPGTSILSGTKEIGTIRSSNGELAIASLRVEDITPGESYSCGGRTVTPHWPKWLPKEPTENASN